MLEEEELGETVDSGTGGQLYRLVRKASQPGNCHTSKILLIYEEDMLKKKTQPPSSGAQQQQQQQQQLHNGYFIQNNKTSNLKWIVCSFGLAVRVLEANTLNCIFDVGRGVCKGTKNFWSSLTCAPSGES
jgi:hypothetical protein